jgi:hypothetical protein
MWQGPLSNKIEQTLQHLEHEASKTDLELSVLREEMTSMQGIFDEGNGHNLYKSNTLNKQDRFEQNFDSVNKVFTTKILMLLQLDSIG